MEPLQLVNTKKEWFFVSLFLFSLLIFSILFEYSKYQDLKKQEVYFDIFIVKNIYTKENYNIVKLTNKDFHFFTTISFDTNISKFDTLEGFINTNKLSFYKYLSGFYANSFSLEKVDATLMKTQQIKFIQQQHKDENISNIFQALFLAIPLSKELQQFNATVGISHLFAISGFHLGIIVGFLYFILHLLYKPIHKNYFPYRNKRFDILIVISIFLLFYLIYIDIVASFLRSFIMFIIGIYLLRQNIKIISFQTLFLTLLIILILFPKFLFSLSLWFSVAGVFYIFLFLHYFKDIKKWYMIIIFNYWIFLAMNPIVHFFFDTTSLAQLFSPFITLLFVIFYPVMLILHIIGFGGIFDSYFIYLLSLQFNIIPINTSISLFIFYIIISLYSIWNNKAFIILNGLLIGFTLYLYLS